MSKSSEVLRLLEDEQWRRWSDAEIARHCRVARSLVSMLRRSTSESIDRRLYVNKHGSTSVMNVSPMQARGKPIPAKLPI
jgi:hypothetical protein